MKICPHCKNTLSDSAVRCRFCRRALNKVKGHFPSVTAPSFLPKFLMVFADEQMPRWGWVSVVLCFAFFAAGSWFLRQQGYVVEWMGWLRAHFYAFTQEPLLQTYVYIFTETFILKIGLVIGVLLFLKSRNTSVAESLGLKRRLQHHSRPFLYSFLVISVLVAWAEGLDPLTPDLPTPLFFQNSATIGNTFAILSIVAVAPLTEEILFRGFFYPALMQVMGRVGSIVVTSVLFAAVHGAQLHWSFENLSIIFAVGFLLTWARARTGSTLYTIGLHAFYNFTLVAAGFIRYQFYGF